jgi:hypothetical protein
VEASGDWSATRSSYLYADETLNSRPNLTITDVAGSGDTVHRARRHYESLSRDVVALVVHFRHIRNLFIHLRQSLLHLLGLDLGLCKEPDKVGETLMKDAVEVVTVLGEDFVLDAAEEGVEVFAGELGVFKDVARADWLLRLWLRLLLLLQEFNLVLGEFGLEGSSSLAALLNVGIGRAAFGRTFTACYQWPNLLGLALIKQQARIP